MGWYFDYLKGISNGRVDANSVCEKRKHKKKKSKRKHKGEFWFGEMYCKYCDRKLIYNEGE